MRVQFISIVLILNFFISYYAVGNIAFRETPKEFDWAIAWINSPYANGIYSDKGYDLAESSGVTLEHRQYLWGDIEVDHKKYTWTVLDHWIASLRFRKMDVSISVGPINTLDFKVPKDLEGNALDDPIVVNRYFSFLKFLVSRYDIKYLSFSNEANFYYRDNINSNQSEYINFVKQVYEMVRNDKAFDGIKIVGIFGLTLIFEGKEIEDDFSLNFTKQLDGFYDIFGLSTYDGILGHPNAQMIEKKLDLYLSLTNADSWAIVETGVSAMFNEDMDYQVQYLKTILGQVKTIEKDFKFLAWLNLFDYPQGFLEAEKFETTGLFFLNGSAKKIVSIFGNGNYYNYSNQAKLFWNKVLILFNLLNLMTLVVFSKKSHNAKGKEF